MTQNPTHLQGPRPEHHAEGGKHRRTEGDSPPLGRRALQFLKLHRTKHDPDAHVLATATGEVGFWRSLQNTKTGDGPLSLERDPTGFPRLEIRRSTKGLGEDRLVDNIVWMMEEKSRLTDRDGIQAHERDIAKQMKVFREDFLDLPVNVKQKIDSMMEAEEIPDALRSSFAHKQIATWADWIVHADDAELGALLNWHYDLTRSQPTERMEAPFREAYSSYVTGLQKAIEEGKIDGSVQRKLRSFKALDLVIPGPLDPLLRIRDGYNFRQVNGFAVSNGTIDPKSIFAHELTHSLGHLMHDDNPESATTEAVNEMLAQIIMRGEDTLQSGAYIPLRRSLRQIMQHAHISALELSKYYENQDLSGFAAHIQHATGFDLLRYLDIAYQRRLRETQDLNRASEEAQIVLSGVIHFIHTGLRDSRDDAIDKPLVDHLIARVNATLL